ncbi:CLUMA_CG008498, isoform A [Clunio marinus]|uniref:CLUMA_CG008498, isoform A n=1 Tax=Clunio marinus TaxID=568069 RepID=A0A1J1I602_9DIPT|nr:CLUMA_CG008498, isoform A [Clunio marinus]
MDQHEINIFSAYIGQLLSVSCSTVFNMFNILGSHIDDISKQENYGPCHGFLQKLFSSDSYKNNCLIYDLMVSVLAQWTEFVVDGNLIHNSSWCNNFRYLQTGDRRGWGVNYSRVPFPVSPLPFMSVTTSLLDVWGFVGMRPTLNIGSKLCISNCGTYDGLYPDIGDRTISEMNCSNDRAKYMPQPLIWLNAAFQLMTVRDMNNLMFATYETSGNYPIRKSSQPDPYPQHEYVTDADLFVLNPPGQVPTYHWDQKQNTIACIIYEKEFESERLANFMQLCL